MAEVFLYTGVGATNGSTVNATTGRPGTWTTVNAVGTPGSVTHDTGQSFRGMPALVHARASSTETTQLRKVLTTAVGRLQSGVFIKIASAPTQTSSGWNLMSFHNGTGFMGNLAFNLLSQTSGRLGLKRADGTGLNTSVATSAFPLNTEVWVECAIKKGTTSTNGTIEYAYWTSPFDVSQTPIFTFSVNNTDTGLIDPKETRFEDNGNTNVPNPVLMWGPRMGDGATGWMGPSANLSSTGIPVTTLQGRVAYLIEASSTVDTGTVSHTIAQTAGPTPPRTAIEPSDGIFVVFPHASSSTTYTITATGIGGSDVETWVVPSASSSSVPVRKRRMTADGLIGASLPVATYNSSNYA